MTVDHPVLAARVESTDGVEIQTYDHGGDGPLLLICHATGFCGPAYEPFARALSDRFHCLSMDFRAHGRSTQPTGGHMRWSGMSADIGAVIERYSGDDPVYAIGHSLGGGALVLAEKARPGSLRALWAFEPILFTSQPGGAEEPEQTPLSEGARRRRSRFASRDEVYDRYVARAPLSVLDDRCLRLYIEHGFADTTDGEVELRCQPEFEARTFEQHRNGAAEAVMEITVPVGVAIGEPDSRVAGFLHDLLTGQSKVEVINYPDISHFGPLEVPEQLAGQAAGWLLSAG